MIGENDGMFSNLVEKRGSNLSQCRVIFLLLRSVSRFDRIKSVATEFVHSLKRIYESKIKNDLNIFYDQFSISNNGC